MIATARPFLAALILSLTGVFAQAAFTVPPLMGAVVDDAQMVDAGIEVKLSDALREVYSKGGPQLAVLTVDTIEDLPMEDASMKVVKEWKLGEASKDNGILLIVAKKERKIRIEVGQGVEGDLTDAYSRRIIDDVMVPLFRQGDFSDAILLGVDSILKRMNPPIELQDYIMIRRPEPRQKDLNWPKIIIFIAIFLLFLFLQRLGGGGGGSGFATGFLLGSMGGGGGRGYGGGGGGWSGGGGGFSGGGASGSW